MREVSLGNVGVSDIHRNDVGMWQRARFGHSCNVAEFVVDATLAQRRHDRQERIFRVVLWRLDPADLERVVRESRATRGEVVLR